MTRSAATSRRRAALRPFGRALLDYARGDRVDPLLVLDAGRVARIDMWEFFAEEPSMSTLEQRALDAVVPPVLDAGAGAGRHTLALQHRGIEVCAADILPHAVAAMRRRGVHSARCIDLLEEEIPRVATLLMLMNGIGLVESLEGLERFLGRAHAALTPGAQLLFDSTSPTHIRRYHFAYRGERGESARWLFVDPRTLTRYARATGWTTTILHRESDGSYLARLRRTPPDSPAV